MISDLQKNGGILGGHRILLVEDSAPLSKFLKEALQGAGAEVAGPAATLSHAGKLAAANNGLSAALLDVRLYGGEEVWPVARLLARERIPFVFYTSHHDRTTLPPEWADRPIITKPSSVQNILGVLADTLTSRQSPHHVHP